MSQLQQLMRQGQAAIEANRQTQAARAPGIGQFFRRPAIAEFKRWLRGGKIPQSSEALGIVEIAIWLEHVV